MTKKVKLKLTPEQETLLITLYAKGQPSNPLFFDPLAREILNQIDYDFDSLSIPYKTIVLICQRAKKIDTVTGDFLAEFPGCVVIQLGCGLDSRFWRVDDRRVNWYDLDMPPVVELRRNFFSENERYRMIATPVTDLDWLDQVNTDGRNLLVVAEGLLMYLGEDDVRRLILGLQERFPECRLVADVFSKLTARSAGSHPSLKSTGATIAWGIDETNQLETWAPGIQLLEEWFFTDDPDLAKLSFSYRLAYRLAGFFKTIQRAHRIVYYQL